MADTKAAAAFFEKIGELDHLVITSGRIDRLLVLSGPFHESKLEEIRGELYKLYCSYTL